MVRVFKTRQFDKWMRKTLLTDEALCDAVSEMRRGLVDADLGGGLFKKRAALPGRGKRAGARLLVVSNRRDRWIFIGGFKKKERDNLQPDDLRTSRLLAATLLGMTLPEPKSPSVTDALMEICHERTQKADPS